MDFGAWVYAAFYLLTWLPGLPIGWRLFGRQTPLGWTAGALIGFGLSAVAFWIPAWLGAPYPAAFAAAWAGLTAITWRLGFTRAPEGLVRLPAWTSRDSYRWVGLLVLVAIFLIIPLRRVGEADALTGARKYRAYFTADFVWHMALTEEVARFQFPPTNPYLAPQPIHYYWTYFMVPAVLAGPRSAPVTSVETALKVTVFGTGLLMFSTVFFAAWSVTGRSSPALAASVIALMAPSWEGLYAVFGLWQRGLPLDDIVATLRNTNIDAVTNWSLGGLRIDGLVRSMWWTPQHEVSFTFGLLSLVAITRAETVTSRGACLLVGVVLALSVATNPFIGAVFCLIYGLVGAWHLVSGRSPVSAWFDQGAVVALVVLAMAWTALNQMDNGAGGAVMFGWHGLGRHAPIATLVLSVGGLLVPAFLSLWPWRHRQVGAAAIAWPALVVSVALAWFVRLTDAAWVGFRAGNILQVTLPMLAASGLAAVTRHSRAMAIGLILVLLVLGAPTTVIDAFNAQDIENLAMGPGFLWTIPLTVDQQAGFRWVRQATAPVAVVQADPVVRGRQNWSLIPSFAGRRMAAGLPISLLPDPAYLERSSRVHSMLTTMSEEDAQRAAHQLGISFLWLDADDGSPGAKTIARLTTRPDLFGLVFKRGAVAIFRVH